jgi:CheY-like chemotaxis protein
MKNLIIERSGRNPRRIKRLINSFVLEYHLNRSWDEIGVENLVKVVLLQHFYPGFYRLLANPRAEDPIVEFLKYHGFRSAVRQGGGERDATQWQELFADRGLRPPPAKADDGVLAAHLERLERELPAEFPLLAADRDFVGLVGSLNGPVSSRQLRQQLRRPLTPDFAAEYRYVPRLEQHWVGFEARNVPRTPLSVSVPRSGLTGLAGLRILWIDDQPLTNQRVIDFLTAQGARVTAATDRATALDAFKTAKPSVVLSDFGRDGVPDAGIDDMEYFRENGVYDGPVIFCSGRGTAERQARLTQLGALGPTNDENEIVRLVMQIAAKD